MLRNAFQKRVLKTQAPYCPVSSSVRTGITLPETLIAVMLLATALIPIFGILTKDMKDTDLLVANSFAIDRARFVLNTLLNDVKFAHLMPGNPAILTGPQAASNAAQLFPGSEPALGGYACHGIASDGRGIRYDIFLRSDPIEDTNPEVQSPQEFTFSFYPNPRPEEQITWATVASVAETTERNNNPSMYKKSQSTAVSPYRYFGIPGALNVWGPATSPITVDQRRVSSPDALGRYYLMQRLILQIRWNTSAPMQPTRSTGHPQRLHVITLKANLD